jgi:hypothetical protein
MNRQKLRIVVFAEQDRAAMVATRNRVAAVGLCVCNIQRT